MNNRTIHRYLGRRAVRGTLIAAIAVGVSLAVVQLAADAGPLNGAPERHGAAIRAIWNRPDSGPVVATAAGLAITQSRLDIELAERAVGGRPVARALDDLINFYVLLAEANRQGVAPSDSEWQTFVASQRDLAKTDPQQQIARYAAALGLTADSYWSDPRVLAQFQENRMVAALKAKVLGPVTAANAAAAEAKWAAYTADLVAHATIVRYR